MKVMVATAVLTLLVAVGWDRPYGDYFAAYTTAYGELQKKFSPQPPAESVVTTPIPAPAPEPTAGVTTPLPPVAPPASSQVKDGSWMWNKTMLDNPRQSGVDRAGVHTFEPLLQNHPQ